MLREDKNRVIPRSRTRGKRLWHRPENPITPLGCSACPEFSLCGGVRIDEKQYDCLARCCGKPARCDKVCRANAAKYPGYIREIRTFDLSDVPRAQKLAATPFPVALPVMFHTSGISKPVPVAAMCLSLYKTFDRRSGTPRFHSHEELCAAFRLTPGTRILLTGTDKDAPLERWWGIGEERRRAIIRALLACGVNLVTTPNYSLFIDVPRWDDMHSMKRIALVHSEFLDEGLPAALHVNGRTEHDFRRWTAFVASRPEITAVAYEFTTGTGYAERMPLHAHWLCKLASDVGRPLHLVVRGGADVLRTLVSTFPDITVLETSAFSWTMHRQRAELLENGRVVRRKSPTAHGAPLDALFAENIAVTTGALTRRIMALRSPPPSVRAG